MISLILDWALFFLVLFFLVPALMIVAVSARDVISQHRQQDHWDKVEARKLPG